MFNLLLFAFYSMFGSVSAPTAKLNVEITNVKSGKGNLWIAVYKPDEKFGGEKPTIRKIIPVKAGTSHTAEFDLEPGMYALAIYHDVNSNEQMDKNFVGIPKEPYGFSKDFRPKISAPSFEDCSFELSSSGQKIFVKLTN